MMAIDSNQPDEWITNIIQDIAKHTGHVFEFEKMYGAFLSEESEASGDLSDRAQAYKIVDESDSIRMEIIVIEIMVSDQEYSLAIVNEDGGYDFHENVRGAEEIVPTISSLLEDYAEHQREVIANSMAEDHPELTRKPLFHL